MIESHLSGNEKIPVYKMLRISPRKKPSRITNTVSTPRNKMRNKVRNTHNTVARKVGPAAASIQSNAWSCTVLNCGRLVVATNVRSVCVEQYTTLDRLRSGSGYSSNHRGSKNTQLF